MNKIDLIIDALDLATETSEFERINTLYKQALTAARELKALKPVAWMLPEYGDVLSASQADGTGIYNIPLYTAPPRKPWVGLTDEEIKGILDCGRGGLVDIKKAEQILKEKNT
jgi:hypothetical protein